MTTTETTPLRTLVTKKGKRVDTPYSDAEALDRLSSLVATGKVRSSDFAHDLLNRRARLTADMMTWVHVLVVEAEQPAPEVGPSRSFPRIAALFETAKEHRKAPAIRFPGLRLKVTRGGSFPGSIGVTDGGPYGSSKWFGRILPSGEFVPSRATTSDVVAFLEKFEADPASVAAHEGHESGSCCFCAQELTDERSLHVGYGPICAGNFGLPWGDV